MVIKCPKCGINNEILIVKYGNKNNYRKVVFDACLKCGCKLTDEKEEIVWKK